MRSNGLTYNLYRASDGAKTFWRWEVVRKSRSKVPLKSGFFYGSAAEAKKCAEAVALRLRHDEKLRGWPKI
jgi:hypothetical protein